jgi:hypothetical protein
LQRSQAHLHQSHQRPRYAQRSRHQRNDTKPVKAALAKLLWKRTTVSQPLLAKRLHIRSAANVNKVLKLHSQLKRLLPEAFRAWLNSVDL